ncbi:MAG: serine/threonine protein phosphatase, partial [Flavobacteriaceae bacterium]
IGHTATTRYGEILPINGGNLWNLDTGAAFYGKLTGMDVETKAFFQSDVVMELYPEEMGRN